MINKELAEVPWNVTTLQIGVVSEILPSWVGFATVDLDLVHDWERYVVFGLEFLDLFGIARFLTSELITWIGNNLETLILKSSVSLN